MSKYKVNINTKLPSEEVINKSKDFDLILEKSKPRAYDLLDARKRMHKRRRYIMWGVVLISVLLALLASLEIL